MPKLKIFLILFFLPVILIISALYYKYSIGEYFLGGFYDPPYNYLVNSLNLAQLNGYGVGNFDHPGTTVQVMGAFIIKSAYAVSGSSDEIAISVLKNPELYLRKISLFLILLNAAALFFTGLLVYKALSIKAAFIFQLTPFYFSTNYYELSNITAEPVMIFAILILLAVILKYLNKPDLTSKENLKYSIIFGLICGFALATKISLFPVLIIPFIIIKKFSNKILFLILTAVSFFIFVIPALTVSNSVQYAEWVRKLITHSGKYGSGPGDFIDGRRFILNLRTIFYTDPLFVFSYLLIFYTIILQFKSKFKTLIRSNKYFALIVGIFMSMSAQIFIVAKHFEPHYLIPAYMLSVTGLLCVNYIFYDLFPDYFGKSKYSYIAIVLIVFSYVQVITYFKEVNYFAVRRDESRKLVGYLKENYNGVPVVSSYGASSRQFSDYLGVYWGGSQKERYVKILREMYPDYLYYDIWSKDFDRSIVPENEIKDKFTTAGKFVFQSESKAALDDFMEDLKAVTGKSNYAYKPVYTNSRETIYEISPN